MKEHDPLCIAPHPKLSLPTQCVYCELIAEVREDERSVMDLFDVEYSDAIDEAIEARDGEWAERLLYAWGAKRKDMLDTYRKYKESQK